MFNQVVILKQTLGARNVTMVQDIKYTYCLLLIFHPLAKLIRDVTDT